MQRLAKVRPFGLYMLGRVHKLILDFSPAIDRHQLYFAIDDPETITLRDDLA